MYRLMNITNQQKAERFISVLRHCQLLGLKVLQADNTSLQMRLPYSDDIIGNPMMGIIHGGALTTLMDTACGTACFVAIEGMELCPTLDLRVDYMKASEPGLDLVAHASVSRITNNVIFTECQVRQEVDNTLVAKCNATFMRIGAAMTPPKFRAVIESGDASPFMGTEPLVKKIKKGADQKGINKTATKTEGES
jgi:uncharacterized protein (TIGR00369 family)